MFQILQAQFDTLEADARQRFFVRLAQSTRKTMPTLTKQFDDEQLLSRICAAGDRAAIWGIETEQAIARFATLDLVAGPTFDQVVAVQRLLQLQGSSISLRLDALLEAVSAKYWDAAVRTTAGLLSR